MEPLISEPPLPTLEDLLGDSPDQTPLDPTGVFGDMSTEDREKFLAELKRLILECEGARAEHVSLSKTYREADRMKAYDASELITPGAQSIRTPLTLSRIDQAHSSVFGALAVSPFWSVQVPPGEEGSVGQKFEIFMGE